MQPGTLLIIDNALDHSFYDPVEHWAKVIGYDPESVHAPSGEKLPEPGRHSHVILTGSEASITERDPWAEEELRWVQQAAAIGVRILGSCWGHQLIAAALGGAHCVRRAATAEFGWIEVATTNRDEILPDEAAFSTFVAHFDEVIAGSHTDMRVLARSTACDVHALRWGDLPVWGFQSHPEVDPTTGRKFLEESVHRWPHKVALFRDALARPVRDTGLARAVLERFFRAG